MRPGRLAILLASLTMPFVSSVTAAPQSLQDIEYAHPGGISLRFDAWLPRTAGTVPAVIIVHGGGWIAGDRKANVEPLFAPLADAGFAWFSISYRLASNVTQFGLAIDDVQSAITFIRAHAAEYGIDPNRMALVGESAGGQLAAMAALRKGSPVKAVVALYTPSDLVSLAEKSDYVPKSIRDNLRGSPWQSIILAGLAQLSPINNVRSNMPPFLFIHGTNDALVPFSQSVDMCNRMRQTGAACEVYPVTGGGHGVRWWEAYPNLSGPYKAKMIEWLKAEFGKAGTFKS